jgi:DNA-directed RNA polymerase alpha subunit
MRETRRDWIIFYKAIMRRRIMATDNLDQIAIADLQLSMQAVGMLKRTQINTVADLMNYTQEDLQMLDRDSADEILQALEQKFGLTLPLNDLQ